MHIPDLQTIVISFSVASCVVLPMLVPLWLKNRKRYRGLTLWYASCLLLALGQLLLAARPLLPPGLSIIAANTLLIFAATLFFTGLERFVGRAWLRWPRFAVLAAGVAALCYFTVFQDSLPARTIIVSLSLAAVCAQAAVLLFYLTPRKLRPLVRLTAVILSLLAALLVSRALFQLVEPSQDLFRATMGDTLHMLAFETLILALIFSSTLLIQNRLMAEVQDLGRERERMLRDLERLAMVDTLTGVPNRLRLDQALNDEIGRARRYLRPLSIILFDVDYFKKVNDSYGHEVGDSVLKEIAALLMQSVRKVDSAGRWGGDEFLIIIPETVLFGAANLAENLRSKIEQHRFAVVEHVAVSLGVAQMKVDEGTESLFKRADDALYRAKNAGRNRAIRAG
jgi:diguanylate cyclase (GGDEF)-like protein